MGLEYRVLGRYLSDKKVLVDPTLQEFYEFLKTKQEPIANANKAALALTITINPLIDWSLIELVNERWSTVLTADCIGDTLTVRSRRGYEKPQNRYFALYPGSATAVYIAKGIFFIDNRGLAGEELGLDTRGIPRHYAEGVYALASPGSFFIKTATRDHRDLLPQPPEGELHTEDYIREIIESLGRDPNFANAYLGKRITKRSMPSEPL